MKCNCSYWKLIDYGFKPHNHNELCPCYKAIPDVKNSENNPYKEEWLKESDKNRHSRTYPSRKVASQQVVKDFGEVIKRLGDE